MSATKVLLLAAFIVLFGSCSWGLGDEGSNCEQAECDAMNPGQCPNSCLAAGSKSCVDEGGGAKCGSLSSDCVTSSAGGTQAKCIVNVRVDEGSLSDVAVGMPVSVAFYGCTTSLDCGVRYEEQGWCVDARVDLAISRGGVGEPKRGQFYEYCSGRCRWTGLAETRVVSLPPSVVGYPAFRMTEPCTPGAIIIRDDIPPVTVPTEP